MVTAAPRTRPRRPTRAAASRPVGGDEALWYKDAIIYELAVRAFYDSEGDGSGDFRGLTQKLDYLADLGVTAIWLLPFYPSPLKDDGYDIADYTSVHPDYGTLRDVKTFIREAHRRNLRVITELVCNHTSDQHPWFQRARRSPVGSVYRDFYVWSDTPDRYTDARIIFKDFETSNWSWDPVANAYYWHRFYSHQPDLNFENPRVREAVKKALDFWLEMGVDGLRLDAIPYLYEEEGTNCENLPRTHEFLRELRAHVDANFKDRMLLAEANQWPEDAVEYLGNGDECHMAFHFPVMPRMFMSVRMEDRFPIYDILEQTPPIPDNAQWALFLRNHDELTLEMVTDEERDYMYRVYAHDPVMRINLGIRRRLAPLMGNNRRRIELLNGLLLALPGTPVLYYGDEIGMGDNFYLGDRNGVRTPMQWSGDRNAGFSSANRQRLFLPVITDPEYHYEAVNVEAQQNNPNSLLWWMKRLIALRKGYQAFGRGSLTFLHPENRRVVAFVREYGEERILVVANLSRFVQYAELDLSAYEGLVPVEMFGRVEFPRLEQRPFFVTLGPHNFMWFSLEADPSGQGAEAGTAAEVTPTLTLPADLDGLLLGAGRARLQASVPAYLRGRRWFRSKARRIKSVAVHDVLPLTEGQLEARLAIFNVDYTEGEAERYVLPLALAHSEEAERVVRDAPQALVAHVTPEGEEGVRWLLYDALYDPRAARALLDAIGARRRFNGRGGQVTASPTKAYRGLRGGREELDVSVGRAEQSNTSVTFADRLILKLFRRLEPGINPDLEVGQALTERGFEHTPAVAGWLAYRPRSAEQPAALGVLQAYVPNQGDAWELTLDAVSAYYERAATVQERPEAGSVSIAALLEAAQREAPEQAREMIGSYLDAAWLLGRRTGEMHIALASVREDPAFAPEPVTELSQRSVFQTVRNQAAEAMNLLQRRLEHLDESTAAQARAALQLAPQVQARLRAVMERRVRAARIRVHGDFHAGQVLWTGKDFVIIDFEGEPGRPLSERRHKRTAMTDMAGMLRSFHYAALGTLLNPRVGGAVRPEDVPHLEPWARFWYLWVAASYLRGYREAAQGQPFLPADPGALAALLEVSTLQKVLYELAYELNNRPDWVSIPLRGLLEQMADAQATTDGTAGPATTGLPGGAGPTERRPE
ncbi:MAG TPA: maltose alpha-D-glucosyltransferase [Candidatus Limnocylindria bacterium]|nr:maltose alpha-D-glucosyltransferase [Candidatus Limnocylindria bacterium]